MNNKYVFRFDDICVNTNMDQAVEMAEFLRSTFGSNVEVIFCTSPLVHDMSKENSESKKQRIFPQIMNAYSDFTKFFKVELCGTPSYPDWIKSAGHGLIHVDHRLLEFQTQELSIIASCSLVGADTFVPPFNKWNEDTENVCKKHGINLIKFEDGWKCMEYNTFDKEHYLWYVHSREFSVRGFMNWFTRNEK